MPEAAHPGPLDPTRSVSTSRNRQEPDREHQARCRCPQQRRCLHFLARTAETPVNAWYRRALQADANLFLGDRESAVADARAVLALADALRDHPRSRALTDRLESQMDATAGELVGL